MFLRNWRERRRSKAVRDLGLVGGAVEPTMDRHTARLADAFDAPVALVSVLDDDMQWIAASHGVRIDCLPRGHGFCQHVIDRDTILEVCDSHLDARFRDLPSVTGEPFVRYYIGTPLVLFRGMHVGVLCVFDVRPRAPASPDQRAYLTAIAQQVANLIEHRRFATGSAAA